MFLEEKSLCEDIIYFITCETQYKALGTPRKFRSKDFVFEKKDSNEFN
jgi:hypothetical protein